MNSTTITVTKVVITTQVVNLPLLINLSSCLIPPRFHFPVNLQHCGFSGEAYALLYRRSYGTLKKPTSMSRGPIHVLNFFRPREPPLRVSLHSASAWAPFRPIEMSRQRRVRGAVDALAWNAAHSHGIWRHREVALLGFELGPVPMALTGRLQEIRLPGGRQVWPGKCVRNFAELTRLRSPSIPPSHWFRTGQQSHTERHWVFKIGVSCRDAARPPPWSRWSSSSRSRAWKRPLGCALSAYEDARLRQPAHERRASVTAGFAYERVSRVNRSRPFPCYGRGRERHVGRGAGACPASAH